MSEHSATFTCRQDVAWVKNLNEILVISFDQNRCYVLRGTEAILWEYLTLGYSYSILPAHLSALLNVSRAAADCTIKEILAAWKTKGIVIRREERM